MQHLGHRLKKEQFFHVCEIQMLTGHPVTLLAKSGNPTQPRELFQLLCTSPFSSRSGD